MVGSVLSNKVTLYCYCPLNAGMQDSILIEDCFHGYFYSVRLFLAGAADLHYCHVVRANTTDLNAA